VIGRAHPDWGEEVVAVVVPTTGAVLSRDMLDRMRGEWIARFKRPKHHFVMAELPKNSYGKVVKNELRTLVQASSPRLASID
jgi:acyl-coenzyme A synthetase/AMP-(fatty) acid ligase